MVFLLLELLFLYLFQSIIRERFATDIDEDVRCQDCKQQKVTLITKRVFYVITLQRHQLLHQFLYNVRTKAEIP